MLFYGKENVFMCLVAFQKIFRKIFSGVWRRRRKRQTQTNPNKPRRRRRRHDRTTRRLTIAIDERCDRQARSLDDRTAHRSRRSSIDERVCRMIAPLVDRRTARSTIGALWSGLSLLSLSLSLFPKIIWSENEGVKSFTGQRWKFRSTGSHFPENEIYRCCQTPEFGGKWFPKIIFPQNKHTLNWQWKKKIKIAN